MNRANRSIDFNFGKEPANSFTTDQYRDLRDDLVMANPPFNISERWDAKLEATRAGATAPRRGATRTLRGFST